LMGGVRGAGRSRSRLQCVPLVPRAPPFPCRVRPLLSGACALTRRGVLVVCLQALATELSMPFLETSAKTSENVEKAFVLLARSLIASS
jgi:hypothetical protein